MSNKQKEYEMKKDRKDMVICNKVSETLLALMNNIKIALSDKGIKKTVLLLNLLIASGWAKVATEEVTGKIIFPPVERSGTLYYDLDTTGNGIIDRKMSLSFHFNGRDLYNNLSRYLNVGWKIIFEDSGLKPFEGFGAGRMIAIISPEGNVIELTQMFPPNVIKLCLPYLDKKISEGRAR